jgi:hypothetical protein
MHPLPPTEKGTDEQMYRVSDTVRSVPNQYGGVVLDIRRGQIFNFNLVGSRIFELLKSELSETQIVMIVSHEFGVSADLAGADVREFLQTLKEHRLIETHDSL